SRRMSGSASSKIAARSSRRTPNAWCSTAFAAPSPNAGSTRPPERRSRLANCFATTAGLRPGRTITLIPNLRRVDRAAAAVIATTGSSDSPLRRSDTHSESNPRRSRSSTRRLKRTGAVVRVRTPSREPARIFVARSCHVRGRGWLALRGPPGEPTRGQQMKVALSVMDFLDPGAAIYPQRTAFVDEPDQPAAPLAAMTFADLAARARAQAAALDELGIGVGERVAIVS